MRGVKVGVAAFRNKLALLRQHENLETRYQDLENSIFNHNFFDIAI